MGNNRVAQGELECSEGMAMDPYTLVQEHARWTRQHVSLSFICWRDSGC
jgi:hypothetical protein